MPQNPPTLDDLITEATTTFEQQQAQRLADEAAARAEKNEALVAKLRAYIDKYINPVTQAALGLTIAPFTNEARAIFTVDGWEFALDPITNRGSGWIDYLMLKVPGEAHGNEQRHYNQMLSTSTSIPLAATLILCIADWRKKVANYQQQQVEARQQAEAWKTEQAQRQEQERAALARFDARQDVANTLQTATTAQALASAATAQPLPLPQAFTIYLWSWAVVPAYGEDGAGQETGYSLMDSPDDRGFVQMQPSRYGLGRVLKFSEANMPVVERLTINAWSDTPSDLVENTFATMPDQWYKSYDESVNRYGWMQQTLESGAPVKERFVIAAQPMQWIRILALGSDPQACSCGRGGMVFDAGLWLCQDCTAATPQTPDEDLPF